MTLSDLLGSQRVLPLVEVDDAAQVVRLARLLLDNGSPVMEIALRTSGALPAIEAVRSSVDGAVVGAGTVVSSDQLSDVARAGAMFAVSPGSSASLLSAAADHPIPFVPGIATSTELMRVAEAGMREVKFFPAEAAGVCRQSPHWSDHAFHALPPHRRDRRRLGAGVPRARPRLRGGRELGSPKESAAACHALAATVVRHRGAFASRADRS